MLRAIGNDAFARLVQATVAPSEGAALERAAEASAAGGHAATPPAGPVRVHVDDVAADAARSLGTRAFTVGRDVFIGAGEYRPGDPRWARLLAHELAHASQQEATGRVMLQRDEPSGQTPGPRFQSVDVTTLGHGELMDEIEQLRTWIHSHDGRDPNYEPAVQQLEELQTERIARVTAGVTWLAESSRPSSAHALVSGSPDLIAVDAAGLDEQGGTTTAPVATPARFDQSLDKNSVPRYEVNDEAAVAALASKLHLPGFEATLPQTFASPVSGEAALRGTWTGNVGELHVQIGRTRGLFVRDLNRVPWGPQQQLGNFPIYDVQQTAFGELLQVKTSTQARQSGRFGVYEPGFYDILGVRRPQLFGQTAQTIFPELSPAAAEEAAIRRGRIAINLEDVPAFRERMGGRLAQDFVNDPARYRRLIDITLADTRVETAAGQRLNTLAQIDAAGMSAQERTQVMETIARRATTQRVTGHLGGPEVANLQQFRRSFGLGAGATPSPAIESVAWPELLMAERAGGGSRGTSVAMGRSAARGGAWGGLIAVAVEGGALLIDPDQNPNWAEDLATVGGLGIVSGTIGAAVETGVATRMGQWGIQSGMGGRGWSAGGRAVPGGVGAGVGAAVFELGSMALSGQDYEASDYAARGTRAAVSGFISGAMSAAVVGAIFGSSVPVVGTVVGFVVGFVGYVVVDWLIGDAVEGLVRGVWKEISEMWDAVEWAMEESPGSFFAPGMVTPFAMRGGYRGLLRNPGDVVREQNARRAAEQRRGGR